MRVRPRLKQQFRPLRRGRGRVQLGLDPALGVVLDGLSEPEVGLLERLDGSHDEVALEQWAGERGVPSERVATLLGTLRAHALLVDDPAGRADFAVLPRSQRHALGPDAEALACAYRRDDDGYAALARRRGRRVLVDGTGNLPSTVAHTLRLAGVGRVEAGPYAALSRASAGADPPPDLVVLAAAPAVDAERAHPWQERGIPLLPVVLTGTGALVGPLVVPGAGPCLRCMDLTRTDLDPAWPVVLAQLLPRGIGPLTEASGETSLVTLAAGVTAMVALAALDGQGHPPGASLEVGLPWPRLAQRNWAPHPACSCGARAPLRPPVPEAAAAQATMAR